MQTRSTRSILAEVERVTRMPGFKGYLSDIGGPSANMYGHGRPRPHALRPVPAPLVPPPRACAPT